MADDIELEGLDRLLKKLDKTLSPEQVKAALGKCCAVVERSAKENAPKGNGDLRRSIASRVTPEEAVVYTPLEYAPYVEYGTGLFAEEGGRMDVPWHYQDDEGEWHSTSGQHPQPFMRPALDQNRDRIKKILREALKGND